MEQPHDGSNAAVCNKDVVCAAFLHENTFEVEIPKTTMFDPDGSFQSNPNVDYSLNGGSEELDSPAK
jgi:hypothetical protein